MKRWIPNPCEKCEEHGASVEIFTDAEQTIPGGACAFDGDACRCSEGCTGWMTADEDAFYCNWHESANCQMSYYGSGSRAKRYCVGLDARAAADASDASLAHVLRFCLDRDGTPYPTVEALRASLREDVQAGRLAVRLRDCDRWDDTRGCQGHEIEPDTAEGGV